MYHLSLEGGNKPGPNLQATNLQIPHFLRGFQTPSLPARFASREAKKAWAPTVQAARQLQQAPLPEGYCGCLWRLPVFGDAVETIFSLVFTANAAKKTKAALRSQATLIWRILLLVTRTRQRCAPTDKQTSI